MKTLLKGDKMKRIFPVVLFLLLAAAVAVHAGEKKGLLIMLDGTRADVLLSANVPNLDSLRLGTWADGYEGAYTFQAHTSLDAPPSSATNHVAILTGVTATKNGCYENGQTSSVDYDKFPPISRLIEAEIPDLTSAWIYMWGEDGDIDTRATYIGPAQSDDANADDAVALLSGKFPAKEGIKGTKWSADDDVDLLMLYIDQNDGAGHGHGFSLTVPEYVASVEDADKKIGRFLEAIKSRPNFANEDWLIAVTADHGGIDRTHGVVGSQNCYTIPLVVSGKEISPGRMIGDPCNRDAAAYMMVHFIGKYPDYFDAKINPTVPVKELPCKENLIAYFPFEGDVNPALGDFAGKDGILPHAFVTDGKIGKALSMRDNNPLCFGKPAALQFGKDRDFTFAFWFRTDEIQKGSAAMLGNKDWDDCFQPGIIVTANVISDEGNKLEFNLGDSVHHHDLNPLDYIPDGQWNFAAITADRDGDALLYLGMPDGKLAFITERLEDFGDINNMDWYLGQDGTGVNKAHFVGDMDELMIWDRALTNEEVYQIFHKGLDGKSVLK